MIQKALCSSIPRFRRVIHTNTSASQKDIQIYAKWKISSKVTDKKCNSSALISVKVKAFCLITCTLYMIVVMSRNRFYFDRFSSLKKPLTIIPQQEFIRGMGCYFDARNNTITHTSRLPRYDELYPSKRLIHISDETMKRRNKIHNSQRFEDSIYEETTDPECQIKHKWQSQTFPSCNLVHEQTLLPHSDNSMVWNLDLIKIISNGYWRDVWIVPEYNHLHRVALKTIRMDHEVDNRNFDRHRRDALVMERLTSSRHIVNIYGYCGNSGIFEYSEGGDIDDLIWPTHGLSNVTMLEKLGIAVQIANGISELHNSDHNNIPSIAHTDITTSQFILIDGIYKLNDFNRCRFIHWNNVRNKPCTFNVGKNPGKFRSPEEYAYSPLTEKIDIYSMGNIFYSLLIEQWPYEYLKDKYAQQQIMAGNRSNLSIELLASNNPVVLAMRKSIEMCWKQNASDRLSAIDVATFLNTKLHIIGSGFNFSQYN